MPSHCSYTGGNFYYFLFASLDDITLSEKGSRLRFKNSRREANKIAEKLLLGKSVRSSKI